MNGDARTALDIFSDGNNTTNYDDDDDDDTNHPNLIETLFARGKVCAKSGRFVELVTRVVPPALRISRSVADLERCKMLCMSSVMMRHRRSDEKEIDDEKEISARESLLKMFLLLLLQQEEQREKEKEEKKKKTLSGRLLEEGGYWFRLSEDVLRYAKDRVDLGRAMEKKKTTKKSHHHSRDGSEEEEEEEEEQVVHAKMFDDVFPPSMLNVMRKQFADVASPFWTQHDYFNPEKKRQFFSYVHDVTVDGGEDTRSRFSNTMDVVIEYAKRVAGRAFPRVLTEATRAEWWCHNRAHCEGHQMHFDSDDEGINGLRHPICSVVVFISANGETTTGTAKGEENEKDDDEKNASKRRKKTDSRRERFVGGPTLVTTQRDGDQKNTNFNEIRGYLAYPKTNRCVVFDGELLHGVVPGRGLNAFADSNIEGNSASSSPPPLPTRTTLMIAFWDKIEVRGSFGSIGSARAFPTFEQVKDEKAHWRHLFNFDDDDHNDDGVNGGGIRDRNDIEKRAMRAPEMLPIPIEKVWHPLNDAAKEMTSLPNYDKCFQGF